MPSGFGHDPELPAGFQDADLEMRELEVAAHEAARAGKLSPQVTCYLCGGRRFERDCIYTDTPQEGYVCGHGRDCIG